MGQGAIVTVLYHLCCTTQPSTLAVHGVGGGTALRRLLCTQPRQRGAAAAAAAKKEKEEKTTTTTTERQKQPMLSAGVVLVGGVGLFEDALFFVFRFFLAGGRRGMLGLQP